MKKILFAALFAATMMLPARLQAAAVETVSLAGGGGTHQGPGAITNAMAAVSDGGEVQIIQAGTYSAITPPSGKTYKIRATVSGVVIDGAAGTAVTIGATTQPLTVTLENLDIIRSSGAGNALNVQLTDAQPTSVSLVDSQVRFTDTAVTAVSQALQINTATGVAAATKPSQINLIRSRVVMLGANGEVNMNALNVASSTNIQDLTINMTSTTLTSKGNAVIFTQGGDRQTWNLTRCLLHNDYIGTARPRGFNIRATQNNCVYNLTDTTIRVYGECMAVQSAGENTNNKWLIQRCTFDNRRNGLTGFGGNNANVRFTYGNTGATNNNLAEFYNTLFLTQAGGNTPPQVGQISILGNQNATIKVNFCTAIAEQVAQVTPTVTIGISANSGVIDTVANTIVSGYGDSMSPPTNPGVGNLIAGPTDDPDAGPGHVFVADTAAIQLDANWIPTATSPAKDAASTNTTLLALVNNRDRRNLVRTALPDIGALEFGATAPVPPVNRAGGWIVFE